MEFYAAEASLPHIPDNISLARFILEYRHEIQPTRGNTPCLIDNSNGRQITLEEVRCGTHPFFEIHTELF